MIYIKVICLQMKASINLYYSNFKSIDLDDYKNNRKEFKLEVNDLVFVEAAFEIGSKKEKVCSNIFFDAKFIDISYENIIVVFKYDFEENEIKKIGTIKYQANFIQILFN